MAASASSMLFMAFRVQQIGSFFTLHPTPMPAQASLFTDKARLFPRSAFVIGYDTAVRLVAPRYYARAGGRPGEDTMEMLLEASLASSLPPCLSAMFCGALRQSFRALHRIGRLPCFCCA